jgi:hypothetical protein
MVEDRHSQHRGQARDWQPARNPPVDRDTALDAAFDRVTSVDPALDGVETIDLEPTLERLHTVDEFAQP